MKFLFLFFYLLCVFLESIDTSPTFFNEKCDEYKRQLNSSSEEFPHIAALAYPNQGNYTFRCGASLISSKHLIFPAHCAVSLDQIRPKFARMGAETPIEAETLNPSTDYLIKKITIHPNYNRRKRSNNIALAELEKEVTFTRTVRPACLYSNYSNGEEGLVKSELILAEWGNGNDSHLLLKKKKVSYVSVEECSMQYAVKYGRNVADGQICASSKNDNCEGDLGGPLQVYSDDFYTLVGVPSHGGLCGSAIPTVYTFVYHYLEWIKNVTCSGVTTN